MKFTLKLSSIFCLMLIAACAGPSGNPNVPQPKKAVELAKYLGVWHEAARYENSFERGCENVNAEYGLRDDGIITIKNSCIKNGELTIADGKAKIIADSNNAKLAVSFFGPFYLGDYWILDHADDYAWAIVGEPSGSYLWILTREQNPSEELMQSLLQKLRALGYDTNMLIYNKNKS